MNHSQTIQTILNHIDENIYDEINAAEIAKNIGYSTNHISRMFTSIIGISFRSYVTWRKLQYALLDLSQGKKVIDVAFFYGFETHAGFTKAFINWFGFPPSLCRLRIKANLPTKPDVKSLTNKFRGGNAMYPHIIELTPFSAIGYPSRHKVETPSEIVNAPTFWSKLDHDYSFLDTLHETFTQSKHFEICMIYDINENTNEFTYIVGRGIDNPNDLANIKPDMTKIDIDGGLYAIFSTSPVDDLLDQAVQDTWNDIFLHWLPQSEFEYDDTRRDFSYHDYRDHGWYFGGKLQLDYCIPIRQREEEMRKSQLRAGKK